MTDTQQTDLESRIEGMPPAGDMLGRFAEKLGAATSVRTVFGDPIERGGITIIPVAKVGLGLGLGMGRGQKGEGGPKSEGSGGGGGGGARPYGYIQIVDGEASFKPIRDPLVDVVVPIVVALTAAVLPRIAKKLIKSRKD